MTILQRHHFFWIAMGALLIAWIAQTATGDAAPPNPPILQLTSDQAVNVRPAWSPDNRQIAYQSNRGEGNYHIYVMDADGKNTRALTKGTTDDRHPVWTPDGKALLFDSFDGTSREIWSINLTDGRLTQLTHIGALANFVAPSPDGQRISFYVYQNESLDLWSARIDGSGARKLTDGLASSRNNQCTFPCHYAAWSPDNRTLVYSAGEQDAIYSIPGDGGSPTALVANGEDNHFPWFLPDGRLGYITEHISPIESWTDAWVYDFNTGKSTPLQQRMSIQGPFDWSSDSKRILFHSPRSGNFQIYLIDLNEPGGIDVLRGTPVPVQSTAPQQTASSPVSASSAIDTTAAALGIGGIFIAAIAALVGVILWRRIRD